MNRRAFIRFIFIGLLLLLVSFLELPKSIYRWLRIKKDPLIARLAPAAFSSSVVYNLAQETRMRYPKLSRRNVEEFEVVKLRSNEQQGSIDLGDWIVTDVEARLWSRLLK